MTSVALLHYSCPPVVGGVEEVLRQQAQVLAKYGHEVRLVVGAGGTTADGATLARGDTTVQIHPLLASGAPEAVEATADGTSEAVHRVAARVEAVLDEALDGSDVVFAHNVLSMPFNLPLTIALRRIAARGSSREERTAPAVVGWNHDSPYFYPSYDQRLDRDPWQVLRDPDPGIRWVTVSEARAREFSRLYGGFCPEVVPNGIDVDSFLKLEPSISALVREERLVGSDLVLVQPSRLHPRKNIELSLRVLAALRDRDLDARLLVTGAHDPHDPAASGYARRLHELAVRLEVTDAVVMLADHVLADGSRMVASRVGIRDLCQVADMLFLPSLSEGFGLPLLEAGLIRLPVACADIPVLREVSGDHAYRFALDDPPEQIAAELLTYLDGIPTHQLYRRVVQSHTWEHIYATHIRP
ncbi:MAG: glycosyltransferase, partial [Nitriliruptorales bacterium]|nr:glycosyltransferase [Nitriliruptorales bacterium]